MSRYFKRPDRKINIKDHAKDINVFEEDNYFEEDAENINEGFDEENEEMAWCQLWHMVHLAHVGGCVG